MDERRTAICEAVLDLAAEGGNRAVTHGAVDRKLDLPKGSTSYYYRTRSDLLSAAIERLAVRSRAAFGEVLPGTVDRDAAVETIASYIERLLGPRRRDALARYALATDAADDPALAAALATCLFSKPAAVALCAALGTVEPEQAAADLLTLLEGMVFDHLAGPASLVPRAPDDLRRPVRRALA